MTTKFNNLAIYHAIEKSLRQLHAILQRPDNERSFRIWCYQSLQTIRNTVIRSISCGYAVSMYPYNYDSELDDLYICNRPFYDDTKTLKDNYIRTYRLVARLALSNAQRFKDWDTSSTADPIYDNDASVPHECQSKQLILGHNH